MPVKKEVQPDRKDLAMKGLEYDALKKQEKQIKDAIEECRVPLEEAVSKFGDVLPNGSKQISCPYADALVQINHTLRTGTVMLPEAIDVIKKDPLLKDCIENIPTIRMDRLEALIEAGKVPDETVKKLFVPKQTYAFSVKIKKRTKDEMD